MVMLWMKSDKCRSVECVCTDGNGYITGIEMYGYFM